MKDSRLASEGPGLARGVVAIAAFVVFVGGAILGWRTIGVSTRTGGSAAASPSATGYYVRFPDSIDSSRRIVAVTNLPDGTLYENSDEVFGPDPGSSGSEGFGCCDKVQDGQIVVSVENDTCNGLVGAVGNSSGFSVTVKVLRTFDDFEPSGPAGGTWVPPQQPASVLAVLGQNLENLTGDQVLTRDDGAKELVATSRYPWPSPQCGGDPLPLFGGPDCQPQQEQLQGDDLASAMTDVMGTITQARMCDFWGIELPPIVEAQHPWPAFAKQWRDWFLNPPKDFSDAQSNSGWTQEPVTWNLVNEQGDRYFVDITDHDTVIISLEVDRLPDYCPTCDPNVVPFWGVVDWTLH